VPTLTASLILSRCPHCAVANPNLKQRDHFLETHNYSGAIRRLWGVYVCGTCGGVVTATAQKLGQEIQAYFPQSMSIDEDIPERPREYLKQAQDSLHAPAGAVMLAASAVDAMLKLRGYTDGTLHGRIEKAATDHVLTSEMASWAHAVRLDANNQRHADQSADLPTPEDATRVIEFAKALGEYLFVLPKRIKRGIGSKATK
jgi:Domain of unknown function (DUF4145)